MPKEYSNPINWTPASKIQHYVSNMGMCRGEERSLYPDQRQRYSDLLAQIAVLSSEMHVLGLIAKERFSRQGREAFQD